MGDLSYPQSMKIVTGRTMASIDKISLEDRGIPGSVLMQNAGEAIAKDLLTCFSNQLQYPIILCGKGNNGGDGFVVAAYLASRGSFPTIILLCKSSDLKGDALHHFRRAQKQCVKVIECTDEASLVQAVNDTKSTFYIDALLGTGVKGAPRGLFAPAIEELNTFENRIPIVSIDIPSGVNSDTGEVKGEAVFADYVYTMGLPKVGHAVPPGLDHCKQLKVLDIGFPYDLLDDAGSEAFWLTPHQINRWLPKRGISAHKGTEGHLLVIAGSRNMPGAALMCANAAVQTGAGLVTLACPKSIHSIIAQQVWEKMTFPAAETEEGSFHPKAFEEIFQGDLPYTSVLIGPGLGRHPDTARFVNQVLDKIDLPILIDGDGLNAVSIETLDKKSSPWIITPHPGEMAKLMGTNSSEIQKNRWNFAKKATESNDGVCVLKGPKTVISCKDNILYINPTGNPAMASGGMGDILSGIIAGLFTRGLSPLKAACCGSFIHGFAADLLVKETQAECIRATEVSNYVQKAICQIRHEASGLAA